MKIQFILPAILALLLAGCATPMDPARANAIRRIGAVSVIGPEIQFQFTGTTVFGNRDKMEHAPDFQSDAVATRAVVDGLGSRYPEVVALTESDRIRLVQRPQSPLATLVVSATLWNPNSEKASAAIRQLASDKRLDTVVVVYPLITTNQYQPIPIRGVGIAGANRFGLKRMDSFANIAVAVFDGQSGKLLSRAQGEGYQVEKLDLPVHNALEDYTPEQRRELAERVQLQIRASITTALPRVGLVR